MAPAPRWAEAPAVVLCLVASHLDAQQPQGESGNPFDLQQSVGSRSRRTQDANAALVTSGFDHRSGGDSLPGALGHSRAALAALRCVCKAWRTAIDTSLEHLTVYRWPPRGTDIPSLFPHLSSADLGWLKRHLTGQQRLDNLLQQLSRLKGLRHLVLGQDLMLSGPCLRPSSSIRALTSSCLQLPSSLAQLTTLTSLAISARPTEEQPLHAVLAVGSNVPSLSEAIVEQHATGRDVCCAPLDGVVRQLPASLRGLDIMGVGQVSEMALRAAPQQVLEALTQLRVVQTHQVFGFLPRLLGMRLQQLRHLELVNVGLPLQPVLPALGISTALVVVLNQLQQLESLVLRALTLHHQLVDQLQQQLQLPLLQHATVDSCRGSSAEQLLDALGCAAPALRSCQLQALRGGSRAWQQSEQPSSSSSSSSSGQPAFDALAVLELVDCPEVVEVPAQVARMCGLQQLQLSGCGITQLQLPDSCSGLQRLQLGKLRVGSLPPHCLSHLGGLTELHMLHMELPAAQQVAGLLAGLARLRRLYLPLSLLVEQGEGAQQLAPLQLEQLEASCSPGDTAMQLLGCLRCSAAAVAVYSSGEQLQLPGGACALLPAAPPAGRATIRISTSGIATAAGSVLKLRGPSSAAGCCPQWFLQRLKVLHLHLQALPTLPFPLRFTPALRSLSLKDNRLGELPRGLTALSHLSHLDLAGNQLQQLPAALWTLPCLQHVDASRNSIATLQPPPAGPPSSARHINLADNSISALPPALLAHWAALQHLDLSNNLLEELPAGMWDLPSLATLALRGNAIELLPPVPPACAAAQKLRSLDLQYNQLYGLPNSITALAALERLLLDAWVAGVCGGLVAALRMQNVVVAVGRGCAARPPRWSDGEVVAQVVRAQVVRGAGGGQVGVEVWSDGEGYDEDEDEEDDVGHELYSEEYEEYEEYEDEGLFG